MESGLIISAIILVLVSAISKAIMDLSEERKIKGNPDYWIKSLSSNRKWKNGNKSQGERFWLSSTVLVMFTDAWHLAGFIYNRTNRLAGIAIGILSALYSWYFLLGIPVSAVLYQTTFHIFYTYKILRK